VLSVAPGADAERLTSIAVPGTLAGEMFVVETSVTPPPMLIAGLIADDTGGSMDFQGMCTIDANRMLTVRDDSRTAMSPVAVPGTGAVRLRFSVIAYQNNLSAPYTYDCDAIDDLGATITRAEVKFMTSRPHGMIGLVAQSPVTFSYLWLTSD
jgi:hypothetical protein